MPVPTDLRRNIDLTFKTGWISADYINTGVPHVVIMVDNLEDHPVVDQGRFVRNHTMFSPAGTNANFMDVKGADYIKTRTYERGVEDETLACGTGAMASVLIANVNGLVSSPVKVATRGGEELKIHFNKDGDSFDRVWLEGSTSIIYQGTLNEEAL
jgi:diaminopimelate epimerase